MQFLPHDQRNVPERFVALFPKVCTTAAIGRGWFMGCAAASFQIQ
jgi:hypothetical protein